MSDLTDIPFAYCSNLTKKHEVKGSKGKTYLVSKSKYAPDWQCNCSAFKYVKADKWGAKPYCKHIKLVLTGCTWNQFIEGGEPTKDEKCPHCGESVEYEMYGV